jgi:hypothetical protein
MWLFNWLDLRCRVIEEALQRVGEEELMQLMARFRQCFVDALKPRHLSGGWQVYHRCAPGWQDLCSELSSMAFLMLWLYV